MPTKPKLPQAASQEVQQRDQFETPAYGTRLLLPFLPATVRCIWEPACGSGRMARVLERDGRSVYPTDLAMGADYDFLAHKPFVGFDVVVTNPPYSLKEKFYRRCLELGRPFALLIPGDYSGWIYRAYEEGCQIVLPSRRIDYFTPNTLERVWEGETIRNIERDLGGKVSKQRGYPDGPIWEHLLVEFNEGFCRGVTPGEWAKNEAKRYDAIEQVPVDLLVRYTSAQFHSIWLTRGLNLPQQVNLVELTREMKRELF